MLTDPVQMIPGSQRWAVLVGIDEYSPPIPRLSCCVRNAADLGSLLTARQKYGFQGRTFILDSAPDGQAVSRMNILKTLGGAAQKTMPGDLLLFYFSGHAQVVAGEPCLVPADAEYGALLVDQVISLKRIKEIMHSAPATAKVIILDACYPGADGQGSAGADASDLMADSEEFDKGVRHEFASARGMYILYPSTCDRRAFAEQSLQHGLFTHFLLRAMGAGVDNGHERTPTLDEVAHYVDREVRQWAHQHGWQALPAFEGTGTIGDVKLLAETGEPPAAASSPSLAATAQAKSHNPVGEKFPSPVKDEKDFFDRRAEVERICGVLDAPGNQPIIIQGERCIGKTSLTLKIKRCIDSGSWLEGKFVSTQVEPSVSTCADFAQELWVSLKRAVRKAGASVPVALDAPFRFDTYAHFADDLDFIRSLIPDTTVVVLIDEFDKIADQCSDGEQKRILGLVRFIVEATDFPMAFVMSVLRDLPQWYGSPLAADRLVLHPFSQPDCDEAVHKLLNGYAEIPADALEWIFRQTAGHPFFVKLLLAKLFDLLIPNQSSQVVTIKMLEMADMQATQSERAANMLEDIYNAYLDDDERYALLWTASEGRLTLEQVAEAGAPIRSALKMLDRRDYLKHLPDGSYGLRVAFLSHWLHEWINWEAELERLQVPCQAPRPKIVAEPSHAQKILPPHITPVGICIDLTAQLVYLDGQQLDEDPADLVYRALLYLAQRCGNVVPRDDLASFLWPDYIDDIDDQRISTLIHRLRKILKDNRRPFKHLETLRKRGFRLRNAQVAVAKP